MTAVADISDDKAVRRKSTGKIVPVVVGLIVLLWFVGTVGSWHRELLWSFGGVDDGGGSSIAISHTNALITYTSVEPIQGFHFTRTDGIANSPLEDMGGIGRVLGLFVHVNLPPFVLETLISLPHVAAYATLLYVIRKVYQRRRRATRGFEMIEGK